MLLWLIDTWRSLEDMVNPLPDACSGIENGQLMSSLTSLYNVRYRQRKLKGIL